MSKQEVNNFFASLMTEVGKNKTGSKMLRNVVGSALALAGLEQAAQADIVTTFNYTGNLQTFTVPTTGWYEFTAYGAQGGNGNAGGSIGGFGAEIGGKFYEISGSLLNIGVGGKGQSPNYGGGGGGGGSFVFDSTGGLMLVAGGGGGGGDAGKNGGAGVASYSGSAGNGAGGGAGGTLGYGGYYGYASYQIGGKTLNSGPGVGGGGGGGYWGAGGGGSGGGDVYTGFSGGTGNSNGGFGGGGAGFYGGGGGGGFSGGGGGGDTSGAYGGGGGGSYDGMGLNKILLSGIRSGNGLVTINELGGVQSVPEPSAVSLFGFGLAVVGAGFAVRRWRELVGR